MKTNRVLYCDGESGREVVRLTREQAAQMSHSGDCLSDVKDCMGSVEWLADDEALRKMLRGYGAWDDLETAGTETLRERALWIAAGDVSENPDDYENE